MATVLVGATSTVATVAYADYNTYGCRAAYNDAGGRDCWTMFWDEGVVLGDGTFYAYGERLTAYDTTADGRGVYVGATWWEGSTRHENGFKLTTGAGTNGSLDLGNIPEGTSVTVTACQTDNGTLYTCRTQTAIA
ncbi:hypothetical protein ACGFJ5_14680 [Micromonospora echinaurantiaca]|uniref:hypothetical protein n=1 Tax=Micromonospora echinaurantiaca TaxID=47857 RepID=UPI003719E56F